MSSKKAVYESSMPFGTVEDELTTSGFTTVGVTGRGAATAVETAAFGFDFGTADSRLTRTDAGTMAVSSGVC